MCGALAAGGGKRSLLFAASGTTAGERSLIGFSAWPALSVYTASARNCMPLTASVRVMVCPSTPGSSLSSPYQRQVMPLSGTPSASVSLAVSVWPIFASPSRVTLPGWFAAGGGALLSAIFSVGWLTGVSWFLALSSYSALTVILCPAS